MSRALLLLVVLLALTGQRAAAQSETLTLVLPGAKERIHFALALPKESAGARWDKFIERWFAYHDRNGDGRLSPSEAARLFPLPVPGGAVAFDFKKADANGDGAVSRAELRDFYRSQGFTPVLAFSEPIAPQHAQISEALFRHLGPDKAGKLTLDQLKRAPELLRRLDENEDEVLTPNEILSRGVEAALKKPAPSEFRWLHDQKPEMAFIRLTPGSTSLRVEASGAGLKTLPAANAAARIRHQQVLLAFSLADTDPGKSSATSRQFVLAQFKSVIGKEPALAKARIADDPSLQLLADIFAYADRNQDGKLTLAELQEFLDLVDQGINAPILVTLADHGRNLFLQLDANADGKLDLRELNSAAAQVAALGGGAGWTRAQVPNCVHIRVQFGFAAEAFGPLPLATGAKSSKAAPGARAAKGPAWFQAMDKNGDGFLSPREFLGPAELFRQLDRDGDGLISVEEGEQAALRKSP